MEAVASPALHTQAAAAGFGQRRHGAQARTQVRTQAALLPLQHRHPKLHGFGSAKSIAGQKVCAESGVLRKHSRKGQGHVRAAGTQSPTRERPSVKEVADKIVGGLGGGLDEVKLDEVAGQVADETGSEKAQISEFLKREYKAGFVTDIQSERIPRGLSEDTVRIISAKKNEPQWMLDYRLRAYRQWLKMEEPRWSDNKYPR